MQANLFPPYAALAESLLPLAISGNDASHNLSHLARVWKNCVKIHAVEGGDLEILAAAVLLHDCVAIEKSSSQRSQASLQAARKASEILTDLAWRPDRITQVSHAIEAHSFSAGLVPESLEAQILQDADRLDAIGAIGIARCFYTAGRMGSDLYEPIDPDGTQRTLNDRDFAIDHFPLKLLRLAQDFQTGMGARLAKERHARLEKFLQDFRAEIL